GTLLGAYLQREWALHREEVRQLRALPPPGDSEWLIHQRRRSLQIHTAQAIVAALLATGLYRLLELDLGAFGQAITTVFAAPGCCRRHARAPVSGAVAGLVFAAPGGRRPRSLRIHVRKAV